MAIDPLFELLEIDERVGADGAVLAQLDQEQARAALATLLKACSERSEQRTSSPDHRSLRPLHPCGNCWCCSPYWLSFTWCFCSCDRPALVPLGRHPTSTSASCSISADAATSRSTTARTLGARVPSGSSVRTFASSNRAMAQIESQAFGSLQPKAWTS